MADRFVYVKEGRHCGQGKSKQKERWDGVCFQPRWEWGLPSFPSPHGWPRPSERAGGDGMAHCPLTIPTPSVS